MARTYTPLPTLQAPLQPTSAPDAGLFHDWEAIGHIRSWFRTKNGTPRQGSVSSLTRGVLRLATHTFNNPHHALQGLEDFSHVWILFVFDKNEGSGRGHRRSKVAPPRLGGQRVGVFGTRSPHRPNPLGLTLARLDKVEGDCLHLSGLDILDGTPVLDIKPYILQYDAPPVIASHFANCQTAPVSTKQDKENRNFLPLGHCLEGEKYSCDLSQKENQAYDKSRSQIETERITCNKSGVSLSKKALENHITKLGKLSEIPATNEDPNRTKGEMSFSKAQKQDNLISESGEEEYREIETLVLDHVREIGARSKDENEEKETHVSVDVRGLSQCDKGEQGSEDQNAVVIAPWITAPPTASLQVLFNPIAEQQLLAFSHQAEDENYRLEYLSGGGELRRAIASVLQQDPRSVYRRRKCASLLYYFSVDTAHITAWFEGSSAEVLRVQPLTTKSDISLAE
ncbi:tRNA (adenine(37)-N6)-methyltransferase-like isoform X1 [Scylla paramamosain]